MTKDPISVSASVTLEEAAGIMRDRDIGDVIVRDSSGSVCGIMTDRDMVISGIAEGADGSTQVDEVCSHKLVALGPDDSVAEAVEIMKTGAIRRLPITDNGDLVGIVSLGDLAEERDPKSALGAISSAPADN